MTTARKGYKMTLSFHADPNDDLKGIIHDTDSVMFKGRLKEPAEVLGLVEKRFRVGFMGVN